MPHLNNHYKPTKLTIWAESIQTEYSQTEHSELLCYNKYVQITESNSAVVLARLVIKTSETICHDGFPPVMQLTWTDGL